MIKLIVAVGKNNLIGNGTKLPWNIPEELSHFKRTTMNSWLLMGSSTFETLPNKLKGRNICVIAPHKVKNAHYQVHNEEELLHFLEKFKKSDEDLFIAGGKSIYEHFYTLADELIVTHIKHDYPGDVHLNWDLSHYEKQLVKNHTKFAVYKYTKGAQWK